MRTLIIFLFLLYANYSKAHTTDSTKKEKLIVWFCLYNSEARGVYFFYPEDTLVIQPIESWSKKVLEQTPYLLLKLRICDEVLDQLYLQGWRLILYSRDDDTYYFERMVKT